MPSPVIDRLYASYFQKSRGFIYPLLEISRFVAFQPYQVYVEWPALGITIKDCKIVSVFNYREKEPGWQEYIDEVLLKNPAFTDLYILQDANLAFVFDISAYKADIDLFWEGKYSQLSKHCKGCVRRFYGIGTPEWAYMESFLYPDRHFSAYARLLEEPEELLREIGELCDPPNRKREALLTPIKSMSVNKRGRL